MNLEQKELGTLIAVFFLLVASLCYMTWLSIPAKKPPPPKRYPKRRFHKSLHRISRFCSSHLKAHGKPIAVLDEKNCDICKKPIDSA